MIFWITNILISWFGIKPATAAKWGKRIFLGLVVLVALIIGLIVVKCAGGDSPKVINEETLQKVKNGDRSTIQKELQDRIDSNAETVRTVDNRTTIAEVNVVERNKAADAKVKQAADAVIAARQQGRDITAEELECLLTGNLCR